MRAAIQARPDMTYAYCKHHDRRAEPCTQAEALARLPGRGEEALRQYRALVNTFQLVDYRPELVRLELLDDEPDQWSAWEIDYADISAAPRATRCGRPIRSRRPRTASSARCATSTSTTW